MRQMTRPEALGFLAEGTRTGKVATVRADGRPHVVPVWFVVEDGDIRFTTWHDSVKARNLRRDPRATLVADLEEEPFAFVMVEGTVTFSDDPDELFRVASAVGGRYMGMDRAEEFGKRNAVEGELVVRFEVGDIVAQDDLTG